MGGARLISCGSGWCGGGSGVTTNTGEPLSHWSLQQESHLHFGVYKWRMRAILAFDNRWLEEEVLAKRSLPLPLRAIVGEPDGEGSGKIGDEATAAAG